jgi:hypothetical protein
VGFVVPLLRELDRPFMAGFLGALAQTLFLLLLFVVEFVG